MYVLIRNLEEKRKTELLEVVKQKDLAIEILCKSKLDYNYLKRKINLLFRYIQNLTWFEVKDMPSILCIEKENINFVIYKEHIYKIKAIRTFNEKSVKLLYNDPDSFVSVKLIKL